MPSGRSKKMSDDEIIAMVEEHPDKAVTAVDLMETSQLTKAGLLLRLNKLNDEGVLRKKRVGSRAVVWWLEDR